MSAEEIKKYQFKPGESGNPAGRPKGSKNLKTILKELLAGRDPDGQYANPLAKKLLQQAFNEDNYKAIVEIINRIEGMPKQSVDLGGQKDNPIQVVDFKNVDSC